MIPLHLVTGFLGSGKTTLLKRLAEAGRERRLVFLVNEFSSRDVDGKLLNGEGLRLMSIAGGSIFCTCKAAEFIKSLGDLPGRFGTSNEPVQGVIVEASGMADPRAMGKMLADTGLDNLYRLAGMITVVDPKSYPKLISTLPNMAAQVEAADIVVLNKVDTAADDELAAVEAGISKIRPGVPVVRTTFCRADLDLFGERPERDLAGEIARCADPGLARLRLRFKGGGITKDEIEAACRAAGDALLRLKGFAPAPGGTIHVDWSIAGFRSEPAEARGTGLECIVRSSGLDQVRACLEALPDVLCLD